MQRNISYDAVTACRDTPCSPPPFFDAWRSMPVNDARQITPVIVD